MREIKGKRWNGGKIGVPPNDRRACFKYDEVLVCNANNERIQEGVKAGWIKFVEDLDIKEDIDELVDLYIHSTLYGVTSNEGKYFDEKAHELRPEHFPSVEYKIEVKLRELDELRRQMEERGEDDDKPKKRKNKKGRTNPIGKP